MTGRRQNSIGDRVLMALVFLFLYAPIIILIVFSFNAGTSSSVWKGFSLKWYESLLSNRLIMNSVYTTLMVSLLSTIVAAIAGTFAAIGLYAMSRRRRAIVNSVNNIPMMNADIVTGVSLCLLFVVFFNGWGAFAGWVNSWQSAVVLPERLTMGFGTLLIAHICFNIPYVILSVGPKLRQMDRNLIDAAQDLGCTWMQAFWRVVIPEIQMTVADYMRQVHTWCKEYVENFEKKGGNLIFTGSTGVGKTFLTNCIAKALIDQYQSVIYLSSNDLFDVFSKNKFHYDTEEEMKDMYQYILDCDLLIIDDLGTELNNTFVSSQLFYCINERLLRKKSTIISTNLSMTMLRDTYSDRISSRIISQYSIIPLYGDDIRTKIV